MPNPWDRPPIPETAEPKWWRITLGIGIIVSEWESVEFELGLLCSHLCGGTQRSFKDYGRGRTFRERAEITTKASENYFSRHCDQHKEGDFQNILKRAIGFSDRRNEIAHGLIINVKNVTFLNETAFRSNKNHDKQYLVIPHLFPKAWDTAQRKPPPYAYNFVQMRHIAVGIERVWNDVAAFRKTLS